MRYTQLAREQVRDPAGGHVPELGAVLVPERQARAPSHMDQGARPPATVGDGHPVPLLDHRAEYLGSHLVLGRLLGARLADRHPFGSRGGAVRAADAACHRAAAYLVPRRRHGLLVRLGRNARHGQVRWRVLRATSRSHSRSLTLALVQQVVLVLLDLLGRVLAGTMALLVQG